MTRIHVGYEIAAFLSSVIVTGATFLMHMVDFLMMPSILYKQSGWRFIYRHQTILTGPAPHFFLFPLVQQADYNKYFVFHDFPMHLIKNLKISPEFLLKTSQQQRKKPDAFSKQYLSQIQVLAKVV